MSTHDADESNGNHSVFVELLGSPGRVKMLEAFLDHPDSQLTAKEVARFTDISESTFSRHVDLFLDLGLIEVVNRVGNTTLYRLDEQSALAKDFAKAQYHLRKTVGDVKADYWSPKGEGPEEHDVGRATDAEETVGEIVPQLFASGDEETREELVGTLQETVAEEPGAAIEMVPMLIELIDDDNETVADQVIATLSYVVSENPDVLDERDLSKLAGTLPRVLGGSAEAVPIPDEVNERSDQTDTATNNIGEKRNEHGSEKSGTTREQTSMR